MPVSSTRGQLGNGLRASVRAADLDRCLATYSSSFDERRRFQVEYRLRLVDREYRWVRTTVYLSIKEVNSLDTSFVY